MMKGLTMMLRKMSASVDMVETITLISLTGEIITLDNATVLKSYESRVAVYSNMQVFLLPRFDYSITTWKHLHAFIDDYCEGVRDCSAREMRYKAAFDLDNGEYRYATGIVLASGYVVSY